MLGFAPTMYSISKILKFLFYDKRTIETVGFCADTAMIQLIINLLKWSNKKILLTVHYIFKEHYVNYSDNKE